MALQGRLHGRNSRIYIGIAAAGTAEPVNFITKWEVNQAVDFVDVTALGDANHVKLAGLPDASGTYAGWYDDGTAQLFTAATDGIARKVYLYPNVSTLTQYDFGTCLFDTKKQGGFDEAVAISGNWSAATPWIRVG